MIDTQFIAVPPDQAPQMAAALRTIATLLVCAYDDDKQRATDLRDEILVSPELLEHIVGFTCALASGAGLKPAALRSLADDIGQQHAEYVKRNQEEERINGS